MKLIWLRLTPPLLLVWLLAVTCAAESNPAANERGLESKTQPTAQSPSPDETVTDAPPTTLTQRPSPTVLLAKAYDPPSADEMVNSVPRDAIPSIYDPEFLTAIEADEVYSEYEPVIGVEIDGQARAYSILHLNAYEIVNDEVAGRKIVVTW